MSWTLAAKSASLGFLAGMASYALGRRLFATTTQPPSLPPTPSAKPSRTAPEASPDDSPVPPSPASPTRSAPSPPPTLPSSGEDGNPEPLSGDYNAAVVELNFPSSPEARLKNMSLLHAALARVRVSVYVIVRAPKAVKPGSPLQAATLQARRMVILNVYDDVYQLQLEHGKHQLHVTVQFADNFMGLSGINSVLMLPDVQAYIGNGESEGYITAASAGELRRKAGLPILPYISVEEELQKRHGMPFSLFEGHTLEDSAAFGTVVMGGTFDRLHIGHRKLLTVAAMLCTDELVVGVTDDSMLKAKAGSELIQPYATRALGVERFLKHIKPSIDVRIVRLLDPYGPTTTEPDLEAIVVSSETVSGANKINDIRTARGMDPLLVVVTQREHAAVVSSTYLREHRTR